MSKVSITRSLLDDLAMSISAKSGEPVPLTLTEMKDAVDSIQTGGGATLITKSISANGTYNAEDDNADGYSSVTVNVAGAEYTRTVIAPQQTVTPDSSRQANITHTADLEDAENYIVTLDGTEWLTTCETLWGNNYTIGEVQWFLGTPSDTVYSFGAISYGNDLTVAFSNTSQHTVKIERLDFVTGGTTLATKTITENGTYNASSDSADGYSSVVVNVSGGTPRTSTDLTVSGATVTAPAGVYATDASKSVASGTAGTPTATKGTVSNHQVSVTPSVTNTTGYITGSTKTGTAVTVSASELVSGSETKTANGTYDVTNLAEVVVNVSGGSGDVATGTLTVASNVNTSTSTQITTTSAIGFTPTKFFFYKTARTATSNHVHQASFITLGSYYIRNMTRYSNNTLSTSGNANSWTTQTAGYLYFNNNIIYFRSSSSYILSSGTWNWVAVK